MCSISANLNSSVHSIFVFHRQAFKYSSVLLSFALRTPSGDFRGLTEDREMSKDEKTEVVCPLSEYAKNLQPHVLLRYKEKISAVGIDPFLVNEKNFDPDRLPPLQSIDLVSFLVLETSFYTQNQFKAFRSLEAYNYMVSGFVQSVQGDIIGGKYVVIGKVRHSQKLNDPCAPVWIIVTKDGTVLSAHCRGCMAGLGECCSHVACVLFYLETHNRIRGKLSSTDMKCSWILPAFVKDVPFAEIKDVNFKSAKKLMDTLDQTVEKINSTNFIDASSAPTSSPRSASSPSTAELNQLFQKLDLVKNKPVVLSLIHPFSESFLPKSSNVSTIPDLFDQKYVNMDYHELMKACTDVEIKLSSADRQLIEEDTREQAKGGSFFRHRAGRIGASVSKQASCTDPAQPSKSLIKNICYPRIFNFTSAATEHGCKHEKMAVSEYEKLVKDRHVNFRIEECGLFVNAELPWLHATPDFLCSCDCCGEGCGEIKCPYCLKDMDFHEYVKKRNSCLVLEENSTSFLLKKDHAYYHQVQQQLFTTGRNYCDFVVCSVTDDGQASGLNVERIQPDIEHWNFVVPKLTQFWRYCILPEILGRWYTQKKDVVQPRNSDDTCFCRSKSESPTVLCSNEACPIKVFHTACLKITQAPSKWLCPLCHTASGNTKSKPRPNSAALQKALQLQSVCLCKKKPLETDKLLECHSDCCESGTFFHLTCLNYKRMPNNASTTWKCPKCKSGQSAYKYKQESSIPTTSVPKKGVPPRNPVPEEDVRCTGTSFAIDVERFAPLGKLTDSHYGIIRNPIGWLDCDIIQQAHILLKNLDPTMEGLQRPTLGPCRNFARVQNPFIQILHTGNDHWVCVSTVRSDDGLVDLYDSLFHNIIQNEVEEQVKCLIGEANYMGLRVVAVQQQGNGSDCGVFAIAFATCLVNGILPQTVQFVPNEMRGHLINCFRNGQLELFPTY